MREVRKLGPKERVPLAHLQAQAARQHGQVEDDGEEEHQEHREGVLWQLVPASASHPAVYKLILSVGHHQVLASAPQAQGAPQHLQIQGAVVLYRKTSRKLCSQIMQL